MGMEGEVRMWDRGMESSPRGKLKGPNLRLPVRDGLQLLASDRLVHALEACTESAHADTRVLVRGRPDDVVVRKVYRRALVILLGARANVAALGGEDVEDDLLVRGPVAAVGEDEDGLDLGRLEGRARASCPTPPA
ncbi:hypothetical protein MRB53_037500 [Persea americana]|nr:hypothetical protein MRB53_037500 [Persea americana]